MLKKSLALLSLSLFSLTINAAILSTDWLTSGDNLITRDTSTGFDWLDLTETTGRSYNDISSKLGDGQEFAGWRYATTTEAVQLWNNFGIPSRELTAYYPLNAIELAAFNNAVDLLGNTCGDSCEGWPKVALGITSTASTPNSRDRIGMEMDSGSFILTELGGDGMYSLPDYQTASHLGSYLVRTSPVPVPATVWLFGSALIGLAGIKRKK